MSLFNTALRGLFDLLLLPFRDLHYLVGLALVSGVIGIIALLVYKHISNQEGLEEAKRKIYAGVFEIRLFNDDMLAMVRAQGAILRHNMTYLRHQVVPLLVLAPPILLLGAQLHYHYGYSGFEPGEETMVKVELAEGWEEAVGFDGSGVKPNVSLELPAGFALGSTSVWSPTTREMAWRVRVGQPGSYELTVDAGSESFAKSVEVGERVVRRSPLRHDGGFLDQLLFPAEVELPGDAVVDAISVGYVEGAYFLGAPGWIWWFVILSVVVGFALKGVFGVTL